MNKKANDILIKAINGDLEKFLDIACTEVVGELDDLFSDEYGSVIAANREVLVFVEGEEEPYVLHVDFYGEKRTLVWS